MLDRTSGGKKIENENNDGQTVNSMEKRYACLLLLVTVCNESDIQIPRFVAAGPLLLPSDFVAQIERTFLLWFLHSRNVPLCLFPLHNHVLSQHSNTQTERIGMRKRDSNLRKCTAHQPTQLF